MSVTPPAVNITAKDKSDDIDTVLECMTGFLRDIAFIKIGLSDSVINIDYLDKLEAFAEKIHMRNLADSVSVLLETRDILKRNINYNLAVSYAVLCSLERLCTMPVQKG